jgi:hypothetical protein
MAKNMKANKKGEKVASKTKREMSSNLCNLNDILSVLNMINGLDFLIPTDEKMFRIRLVVDMFELIHQRAVIEMDLVLNHIAAKDDLTKPLEPETFHLKDKFTDADILYHLRPMSYEKQPDNTFKPVILTGE